MIRRVVFAAAAAVGLLLSVAGPAAAQGDDVSSGLNLTRIIGIIAIAGTIIAVGFLFAGYGLGVERDLTGRLGSVATPVEPAGLMGRMPFFRRVARGAESAARKRGVLEAINSAIERAGLPLRPGEGLAIAVFGSLFLGFVVGLAGRSLLLGVAVAGGGIVLLVVSVQAAASQEQKRFEEQIPDTLNLIASSLRAGYSLLQATEAVAQESQEPTGREFNRALNEIRLGEPIGDSLRRIAIRMASTDFEWVVQATEIQTEVGGNLAEVLASASDTVLARSRLRREVRALTAEGRISAIVLISLPFALFGFLWATNREYLDPLVDETGGKVALGGAAALVIVGIIWIRNITNIEP
jgi:tight adherence protein B